MKQGIEHLRHIVYKAAKQKHPRLTRKIVERLESELDQIETDNKQSYFLSIMEIFKLMKVKDIYAGSYSVLSSLVAHYINISPLNPINYYLLFERNLNRNDNSINPFEIYTDKKGLKLVDDWLYDNEKKLSKTKNLISTIKGSFILDKRFEFLNKAVLLIQKEHNEFFQIDKIPMSDYKTMKLFQKADTEGIPGFSSNEICKHLKKLKPTSIQELMVLFAMYRPGSMEFIPNFVKRKMKQEKIIYPHPLMKKYLNETGGIIVYQEQIMLLAHRLAAFTIQEAESMRIALVQNNAGFFKKKFEVGCKSNELYTNACKKDMQDIDDVILKIWNSFKMFSKYAVLKSYAVHNTITAFQIAFIKAHYKNEFRAITALKGS